MNGKLRTREALQGRNGRELKTTILIPQKAGMRLENQVLSGLVTSDDDDGKRLLGVTPVTRRTRQTREVDGFRSGFHSFCYHTSSSTNIVGCIFMALSSLDHRYYCRRRAHYWLHSERFPLACVKQSLRQWRLIGRHAATVAAIGPVIVLVLHASV